LAVLDADEDGMRKYAYEVAGIGEEHFPLFASAITGRDYTVLAKKEGGAGGVMTSRTNEEKKVIGDALGEGMLESLIQLLGQVPRVILLILKTNDLSKSLERWHADSVANRYQPDRSTKVSRRDRAHCALSLFLRGMRPERSTKSHSTTYLAAFCGHGISSLG
jgi:hypothetical protein